MKAEDILQCLEAVITYEKGEGTQVIEYDNEFLLSKEDIETLLRYINELKEGKENV